MEGLEKCPCGCGRDISKKEYDFIKEEAHHGRKHSHTQRIEEFKTRPQSKKGKR